MGKVILHTNPDPERSNLERAKRFQQLSTEEKLKALFKLNALAIAFNGGKPIKTPQGKGIVISKPST
jgi:hypothetical protein